jgi:hypothetical protein
MVTYAKGRPPQKHREKEGDSDYEEWIYGTPPQDVEFIRFVGDEVTRIEVMKVDGTKQVRTDREIVLPKEQPEVAQQAGQPSVPGQGQASSTGQPASTTTSSDDGPKGKPSLKRPGEETNTDQSNPAPGPARVPPPSSQPDTIPKPPGSPF